MIRIIQRYAVFIKAAFIEQFQYRLNFLISLAMSSMVVILNYFLWNAVFAEKSMIAGITLQQMITYVIVSGSIQGAIIYNVIQQYGELVEKGDIVLEMQRPVSLPVVFFSRGLGTLLVFMMTRGIPIFIVGALVTKMIWPSSPATWFYFAASLLLSFTLYYLLGFAIAQILNYMETYWALICTWNFIMAVFTGQLIPFAFFPQTLKSVLFCMPFYSIFYTPISIFLEGQMEISILYEFLITLGVHFQAAFLMEQLIWIIILIPLLGLIWAGTGKHILIQGA